VWMWVWVWVWVLVGVAMQEQRIAFFELRRLVVIVQRVGVGQRLDGCAGCRWCGCRCRSQWLRQAVCHKRSQCELILAAAVTEIQLQKRVRVVTANTSIIAHFSFICSMRFSVTSRKHRH
jgi:hypothetical protein